MPALDGAVAAAHRRHGLEVEDEGHLKNSDVIFLVVDTFCPIRKNKIKNKRFTDRGRSLVQMTCSSYRPEHTNR
jgi:hypothetical protein